MKRVICLLFLSTFLFSTTSSADDFFENLFGGWDTRVEKRKRKKRPAIAYNTKDPKSSHYLEPQKISPQGDKALLGQLLKNPANDSVVNILFIAQDKPGPKRRARRKTVRSKGGKRSAKGLASRADILFILSLDKENKRWSFYSFYRGIRIPSYCKKANVDRQENYLANYYFYLGRKALFPCLERMMNSRLQRHPELSEAMNVEPGKFRIHAFFEGTKESTIRPLAKDVYNVATSPFNTYRLAKIYGFEGLTKALSVITNRKKLRKNLEKALNGENVEKKDLQINTRNLYVEAKERMAYRAGGYQRAFNFARMIADFLAWVGYAVHYDPSIYEIFEPAFNKNFSRSHSLKSLINLIKTGSGENSLRFAAQHKGDANSIDIVQFGKGMSYRAYSEGQWANRPRGPLRDLVIGKPILPQAPVLDIARPVLN